LILEHQPYPSIPLLVNKGEEWKGGEKRNKQTFLLDHPSPRKREDLSPLSP